MQRDEETDHGQSPWQLHLVRTDVRRSRRVQEVLRRRRGVEDRCKATGRHGLPHDLGTRWRRRWRAPPDRGDAQARRPPRLAWLPRRRRRRQDRRKDHRRRRQGSDACVGHRQCRPDCDGHRPARHSLLRDARCERWHQHGIRPDEDGAHQLERVDDARSGRCPRLLRRAVRHHEVRRDADGRLGRLHVPSACGHRHRRHDDQSARREARRMGLLFPSARYRGSEGQDHQRRRDHYARTDGGSRRRDGAECRRSTRCAFGLVAPGKQG